MGIERKYFLNSHHRLSYLDSGGDGPVLIALHGHWMEATTFLPLAVSLSPEWRIIALDQRGHGYSDHTKTYIRDDYISDLAALITHLNLSESVVLLGNTLGGVNSYQFAARYPTRVRAMIIEDIGVEISGNIDYALNWSGIFPTRSDLENQIDSQLLPYLQDSIRGTANGWRLAFDPAQTIISHSHVLGNHWSDWLASHCPALLIRGQNSRVTTQEHCEAMIKRRPNTQLCVLDGGHVVHHACPSGFAKTVHEFLSTLPT
ncbi:MAG: alpha/beta hydrolase [Pseudomonadota bacterium]